MRFLRRPPDSLLIAVLIGALPLAALVLLFGGGQFNPECHFPGGVGVAAGPSAALLPAGCAARIATTIPVIGTDTGAAAVLAVLVVGWVVAAALLLASIRRRPGALAEVLVATGLGAAAGVAVGFLNGMETAGRLLTGSEEALVFGLSAALVVFIIAVGTATVAPSRDERGWRRSENRAAISG